MQGLVAGCFLATGYAIGVLACVLWTSLKFQQPGERLAFLLKLLVATGCMMIVVACFWQAAAWQNSIRVLMGLGPVATAYPPLVALISIATFAILLMLARLFGLALGFVAAIGNRLLPKWLYQLLGLVASAALLWSLIDGLLVQAALRAADASHLALDTLIDPEIEAPADPRMTGSSASLLAWHKLGPRGRGFISSGPTSEDISAFSGRGSLQPIRVYVGLRSADTLEARAKLALEELKRAGGFERSLLILVTPTGSGWVDPAALDSVEYLHDGDVASVALQFSYLGSWLYFFSGADYGADAAHALFTEIHGYWSTLPKETRPRLYLHGLSLGAKYSEQSTGPTEVPDGPFDGALWSGPTFSSQLWRSLTDRRNPTSPAWLPRYGDGSHVRFMNQNGFSAIPVHGTRRSMGAPTRGLSPVCKRSSDLFRVPQPLS